MSSAGRRMFSGTSFCTARTVMPGTISCSTTAKTRIAEKKPPVAGSVIGRNTLSSKISARSRIGGSRRLRGGNTNPRCEIHGRQAAWHARKQRAQLAESLEFFAAADAFVQMLAQINPLLRLRSAGDCAVHVSNEFGAHGGTVHGSSSPFEFLRMKM